MRTLDEKVCAQLAQEVHEAEARRSQIGQLSRRFPEMTIEDGYAISREWASLKKHEGQRVVGHKIGLTSRAMQVSSNIDEPDFGTLFDEMVYESGQGIAVERFIMPRVEVELAFYLKKPLGGPHISVNDVLNATDRVVPALEIIDARIERVDEETGATRKVFDTISDNAANAGIVLGGNPVLPDAVDLGRIGALLYINGVVEESGLAAAVLGHPANGIAWLARRLHGFGERLDAGEVVLAGSFTRPVSISQGDVIHADYGPLGGVSFQLV